MKLTKKIISAALAASLMVVSFSGCSEKENTNVEKTNDTPDLAYKISDKKITLDLFYTGTYGSAVDEEAGRLTNIYVKNVVPASTTDATNAYNVMLASGNIPDLVSYSTTDIEKEAFEGAFVALDEYIDELAPNIKKFLDENPDKKASITSYDGHIYSIPLFEAGETAAGYYIRQDWLDKLGLKAPTTIDELYTVLKAFKEQDPNGNGIQDEIPFFQRSMSLMGIISRFDLREGFYVDESTDSIVHGKYSEKYKMAIETISKWYKEGLIDPDIFTRGSNAREELLGNDIGGMTHDWFASTSRYNEQLQDKIEGFNFAPVAPPADINGKVWESSARMVGVRGYAVSADSEYIEEAIKYMDFWFSEPGLVLQSYGVEGKHFNYVDGAPVFTDEYLSSTKSMNEAWASEGITLYRSSVQNFDAERQWMAPAALEGAKLYIDNGYCSKPQPQLSFSPDEKKVLSTKWTAVDTYMKEMEQKWILGKNDVTADWNEYIETCKSFGMEEILKIYNDAYTRYKEVKSK